MVQKDEAIKTLNDLKNVKIGVAGGPLDKSWLLLQTLAKQQGAGDLSDEAEVVFGAAPLLNEQMISGNVDAVLNFWHFAARLEGDGYRRLIGISDVMKKLGIAPSPIDRFCFSGKPREKQTCGHLRFFPGHTGRRQAVIDV